jgi:hypothetical protein
MSGRKRGDTTLHEFEGRFASVLQLKRWLAIIGALVVMGLLGGLFLMISFAIRETGRGADPNVAFSPTENVPGALAADIAWLPDADATGSRVAACRRRFVQSSIGRPHWARRVVR